MSGAARLALSAVLLVTASAAALAQPAEIQGGTATGQPASIPSGLSVQRQTLDIDLRPIALRGFPLGLLEATYLIRNATAEPLTFDLPLFSRTSDESALSVTLDGLDVPGTIESALEIPALWRTIESTPALDDVAPPYRVETGTPQAPARRFQLVVPPGQHQLIVKQRLRLGSYDDGATPNRIWQVAYSLAPSRFWAGFGQLDVTITVPEGWQHAASIPLRAEPVSNGTRLSGRFAGIPGDILAVSLRALAPPFRRLTRVVAVLCFLLVCAFVGWIGGRLVAERGRKARWSLALSLLSGTLATVAFIAITAIADDMGDSLMFASASVYNSVLALGPFALVLGTALTHTVTVAVSKRIGMRAPLPLPEAT